MADTSTLYLRFRLESQDAISPSEFLDLFNCIDAYARAIAELEGLRLFDALGIPSEDRLIGLRRIRSRRRRTPTPAEVIAVDRGSWVVDVAIPAALLLFFLREYVHPMVHEAWTESRMREEIKAWLRDRVFRGAKETLERKAIAEPRYGNLKVQAVTESRDATRSEPRLEIRLERSSIIEVHSDDQRLIDDFVDRLNSTS